MNVPTYVPSDQSSAQGRQFLYTQAYITPPQPQDAPRPVYAQPTTVYTPMHGAPVYRDAYARPSIYAQDNSLQGNIQYAVAPEYSDSPAQIDDESPNQISSQSYAKVCGLHINNYKCTDNKYILPKETVILNEICTSLWQEFDEPTADLVPPQVSAQDFKPDTTHLLPVSLPDENPVAEQNHVDQSEPRSLLDSYVPSKLIAAQDTARWVLISRDRSNILNLPNLYRLLVADTRRGQ